MVSWLGFCHRCGPKPPEPKQTTGTKSKPPEPKSQTGPKTSGTKTNQWNQKPVEPTKKSEKKTAELV